MAKFVGMTSAVENILLYVKSMNALDPSVGESVAAEQAGKAVDIIRALKCDVATLYEDGNAALQLLAAADCPLDAGQRAQITAAIRLKIEGGKTKTGDQQENDYVHQYLPEWLWELIRSHAAMEHVFEHIATYCVTVLKMRNPSETTRRDLVAVCLCARGMNPSREDALVWVEKMRKHFDAARTIHAGERGPAVYPSNASLFVRACGDALSEADRPVASKVTDHALSVLIKSTPCRDRSCAAYSVAPRTRTSSKTQPPPLKQEEALDSLAKFVTGQIVTSSLAALPGVGELLKREVKREPGSQPASSSLHESVEAAIQQSQQDSAVSPEQKEPKTCSKGKPLETESGADLVGDISELREITRLKFAKMGIALGPDGKPLPKAKAKGKSKRGSKAKSKAKSKASAKSKAKSKAAAKSKASGKSKASAKSKAKAKAKSAVRKRPASALAAGFAIPKGWTFVERITGSGRKYPVWTSPSGKQFYSRLQVAKAAKAK